MKNTDSMLAESATRSLEDELALNQVPVITELAPEAEAGMLAAVAAYARAVAGQFTIHRETDKVAGRRLALADGRLVYVKEREPDMMTDEYLLLGIIATNRREVLANPDRLLAPGLDIYFRIQQRLAEESIDLCAADSLVSINLELVPEQTRKAALFVVRDELAKAAAQGPIHMRWLRHGGVNGSNPLAQKRTLKTDVMRLSLDGMGNYRVERDPHKTLTLVRAEQTFALESTDEQVNALIRAQKAGAKLSSSDQRAIVAHRTMENGVRHNLLLALHEPFGLVQSPEGDGHASDVERRLRQAPELFAEPLTTLLYQPELEHLRQAALVSGAWTHANDEIRSTIHDADSFLQLLSTYDPAHARQIVLDLARMAEYYANAKALPFNWGLQGPESTRQDSRALPAEQQPASRNRSGPKLAELFDMPPGVLPSSVYGVALALGLFDSGHVYIAGRREHLPDSVFVYGTTDFGNPAELIMTAVGARAGGRAAEAVYFADFTAHTIGSYAQRILVPTLASLYNLGDEAATRLNERARAFDEVFDVDLPTFLRVLDCPELTSHMAAVQEVVGPHKSFADLYRALNQHLANQLGVRYADAQEVLESSSMTIGEFEQHIATISQSAQAGYRQIEQRLRTVGEGDDRIRGILQSLFGASGAWGEGSRKFLRANAHGEAKIDVSALPSETKLSDLRGMGITLGGNAWGVLMRVLNFGRPNTIVGDKNTAQGGNYATSVMGAENAQISLLPIVRVVPDTGTGKGGDGLDITAYVLHPQLIPVVETALQDTDQDVVGGQAKMVVEVAAHTVWLHGQRIVVRTVEVSREPTSGGNRERVAIGTL